MYICMKCNVEDKYMVIGNLVFFVAVKIYFFLCLYQSDPTCKKMKDDQLQGIGEVLTQEKRFTSFPPFIFKNLEKEHLLQIELLSELAS